MRVLLPIVLLLVPFLAAGAPVPYDHFPVGTKALGAGGAFTGQADDLSALSFNTAGLVQLEGRHLTYQLYSLLKINRLVDTTLKLKWEFFPLFAFSFPVVEKRLVGAFYFRALFRSFLESYSVHVLGGALGWKVTDWLALGLDAGLAIGHQDINWAAGFHLQGGALFRLGSTVKAGLSFRLPVRLSWDMLRSDPDVAERLPWTVVAGAAWRAGEHTILTFDLEWQGTQSIRYSVGGIAQDPDYPVGLFKNLHPHCGVQHFSQKLGAWLRAGMLTMSTASSAGLESQPLLTLGLGAYTSKFFRIDFSILDSLIFDIFTRTNRFERFLVSFEYTY